MLKWFTMLALVATSTNVAAQSPSPAAAEAAIASAAADETSPPQESRPGTRQAAIEEQQAAKEGNLHPYIPNKGERIFQHIDTILEGGTLRWHPFFENAYSGGGFTLGLGHVTYLGGYNFIDLRGSYTLSNYKRVEAEFVAPRLFNRRGQLSVHRRVARSHPGRLLRHRHELVEGRPHELSVSSSRTASALLTLFPTRRVLMLRGGAEYSRWTQEPGEGSFPSVETVYTPETLPGLGAEVTYLHTQGTVGFDWRTSPGYSRRGGFYGVTLHDYHDRDDNFGFQQVGVRGHPAHPAPARGLGALVPRARPDALRKDGQQTPFFMLPALGGGSSLRGYSSWRFRDQNSLLLQGEWRIMVNRYLDMAFFYDAGKVAPRTEDLDLDRLKDDFGFGMRFHGPFATPLRVELAKSREGLAFVFSRRPLSKVTVFMRSTLVSSRTRARRARAHGCWRDRLFTAGVSTQAPRFYPDDPIAREPESQDASKAAPYEISPRCTSWSTTCSSVRTTSRAACARRTSTRSTKFPIRAGSPTASARGRSRTRSSSAAPNVGAPPDPSKWVLIREKSSGAHPASRRGTPRATPGSSSSIRRISPEGATAAVAIATKIFWALGYNQVETYLTTFDPKNASIDPQATVRRPSGKRTPFTKDDMNAILERVARNADGTYRIIAGRLLPGKILGGYQYRGHASRRSERSRPARGSSGTAGAARLRRLDEPDGSQSQEHARHARNRKRQGGCEALPAGRRLDVRPVQRLPRMGPELRILL